MLQNQHQQQQQQTEQLISGEHSQQGWKEEKEGFAEDISENIGEENELKLAAVADINDVIDKDVERGALGELNKKRVVRFNEIICFDDATCNFNF